MMNKIIFQISLLALLMFLAACTSTETIPVPVDDRSSATANPQVTIVSENESRRVTEDVKPDTSTVEDREGSIEAAPIGSSARDADTVVLAFLNEAELQAADGNTDQAIASLERGVRIKPKDPWLWHQLAVLRLQKQQWQEAITMAEKSIALSGSNKLLLSGNWQIIATARRATGDDAGARAAEIKVKQYQPSLTS